MMQHHPIQAVSSFQLHLDPHTSIQAVDDRRTNSPSADVYLRYMTAMMPRPTARTAMVGPAESTARVWKETVTRLCTITAEMK